MAEETEDLALNQGEDTSVRMAEFREMNLVFYPSEAQQKAADKAYQKKVKAYKGGRK